MRFEVWQEGIDISPLTIIEADNNRHAWKVLKKMGIKNKSKLINLVEIE